MVDPIAGERGEGPGERRAPVVPDHMGSLDARVSHHRQDVADEHIQRIGLRLGRLVGVTVAAQVRDDHPKAGLRERWHLVAPQPPRVGEAVQQHHRSSVAVARHLVLDAYTFVVDAHRSPPVDLLERVSLSCSEVNGIGPGRGGRPVDCLAWDPDPPCPSPRA